MTRPTASEAHEVSGPVCAPNAPTSVAFASALDEALQAHLLRTVGEEELTFALWRPSHGEQRTTALLCEVVWPMVGDRQVHGNVSFNASYVERAIGIAQRAGCGLALLHSHVGPGWQTLSFGDEIAERRTADPVEGATGLPLLGLTLGTDGTWSARTWRHDGASYQPEWCASVRAVGPTLRVSWADQLMPRPVPREEYKRTRRVLGSRAHDDLARLRIGIVGLGSVGMAVAEALARAGHQRFTLIDFDEAQPHNLDRLQGADVESGVSALKVNLARDLIKRSATAAAFDVRTVEHSVVEVPGYQAALDCDVLLSCVDRPWARHVLNHIAYAHLIPVIDGGISVRLRDDETLDGVEWECRAAAPGHACLACLQGYSRSDVDTDRNGLFDDPSYIAKLPVNHTYRQSENVYAFSTALASMECLQLIALAGQIDVLPGIRVQRHHWIPGITETREHSECETDCPMSGLVAVGDSRFVLTGRDRTAERARLRQQQNGGR